MWVHLQHFLQQNTGVDPFICCEEDQELRYEENHEHPRHMEEKATGVGVTIDGYIKVQSTPYAYDRGAEAQREDPQSTPLLGFSHPLIWGVARSDSISRRVVHLFCGSVRTTVPAK